MHDDFEMLDIYDTPRPLIFLSVLYTPKSGASLKDLLNVTVTLVSLRPSTDTLNVPSSFCRLGKGNTAPAPPSWVVYPVIFPVAGSMIQSGLAPKSLIRIDNTIQFIILMGVPICPIMS